MNKVMTRKIVLLSLIGVLLCVYILQLTFTGRSKIEDVSLEATPDSILIVKGANPADATNSVRLAMENNVWVVGEQKYPADSALVTKMTSALKTIKLLGVITRVPGNGAEKYGLSDADKMTVTGFKDGKALRTVTVGKNTTSGSQCYMQIDGKDTVYLVDGAQHDTFGVTVDTVRSKEVYTAQAADISSVRVTTPEGSYAVQKIMPKADLTNASADAKNTANANSPADNAAPAPQSPKWTLTENTTSVKNASPDEEKTATWASSLASLKVSAWAGDSDQVPATNPEATVTISAAGKEYTVAVYSVEGDDSRCICSSSATPYRFYISKYTAEKYIKHITDLMVK